MIQVENPQPSDLALEDLARLQRSVQLDPYHVSMQEHFKLVEENKEQLFVFSWSGARVVILTTLVGENLHVLHIGGNTLNENNAQEIIRTLMLIAVDAGASALTASIVNPTLVPRLIAMGFSPIAVEMKLELK